jgi:hypothetical protein
LGIIMARLLLLLLLATPAFGQFGPAGPWQGPFPWAPPLTQTGPPPARPWPVPPIVIAPIYPPVYGPVWGYSTGQAPVPVPQVTIIERLGETPPPIKLEPLNVAFLSSAEAAKRRAQVVATVELRTVLTLTLPVAGKVWLDDRAIEGTGPTFELNLPAGKKAQVRAEWMAGGGTYEYVREFELPAGEKQAVAVFRGEKKR